LVVRTFRTIRGCGFRSVNSALVGDGIPMDSPGDFLGGESLAEVLIVCNVLAGNQISFL
jgi:hypothetical protein